MCVGSGRTDPTYSSPTPWKWVLLVKLIVAHKQLRNSLPFRKSYVSFSYAQQPTVRFYLDLDKSSAHLLILFLKKPCNIIPSPTFRCYKNYLLSDSLNKTAYTLLLHTLPILSSTIIFNLITFGEGCKLWRSSLRYFLQPLLAPALLGPNILLETLFLNTLLP